MVTCWNDYLKQMFEEYKKDSLLIKEIYILNCQLPKVKICQLLYSGDKYFFETSMPGWELQERSCFSFKTLHSFSAPK